MLSHELAAWCCSQDAFGKVHTICTAGWYFLWLKRITASSVRREEISTTRGVDIRWYWKVLGGFDQGKTFHGASEPPSRAAARGRFGHVS